jgi:poly-beta-1,6-N-acetyl-D-glucosamine synthase
MKLKPSHKLAINLTISLIWVAFTIWISQAWVADMTREVHIAFAWTVLLGVAVIPGWATMFILMSLISDRRPKHYLEPDLADPVTILIAAYNEEKAIATTINSIMLQKYAGPVRIIVIDDGSKDATASIVAGFVNRTRGKICNVELISLRQNSGKSAALNRGLLEVGTEFVLTVDADTYLYKDALSNIVKAMVYSNIRMGAVAGTILVRNSRDNFLTKMQEWDYFHGIAVIKRAQSLYYGTLVAQGAFSIYRTEAVRSVGGWADLVGEDIVLTWALRSANYRIGYCECAFGFTNVPDTLSQFYRQRKRWARGLIEAFKSSPKTLVQLRMNSPFIWYNLLFPFIDASYILFFVPGVILAIFGYPLMAGLLTILLIPMMVIGTAIYFGFESDIFKKHGLRVRKNQLGLIGYLLVYQLLMTTASLAGYLSEFTNRSKSWGTK